jgi:hypothetical protein
MVIVTHFLNITCLKLYSLSIKFYMLQYSYFYHIHLQYISVLVHWMLQAWLQGTFGPIEYID